MDQIEKLLFQWEESYKKGLLSFWILLLLHERPAYPYEMGERIREISQGTVTAEDNSIYRALKRFEEFGLVKGERRPSELGPDRKYYRLTQRGISLLARFIERNILVFDVPVVDERIQNVLNENNLKENGNGRKPAT